jgi:hypothetical protein
MTFRSCGDAPVDLLHDVGIAIRATDVARQLMHVGLLYRSTDGEQRFLHLAFHHDLQDQVAPVNARYFWADCAWLALPDFEVVGDTLVSYIESVREETKVPYGFDGADVHFDGGGHYVSLDQVKGLTCATFIATVLESAGIPVVDLTTWQPREDDEKWRAIIMDALQERAPDRATEVAQSPMEFRLRPDEIAGASSGTKVPLVFQEALTAAQPIRAQLFA